jgi:hypothetical protein
MNVEQPEIDSPCVDSDRGWAVGIRGAVASETVQYLVPYVQDVPAKLVEDHHTRIREPVQLFDLKPRAIPMGSDDTAARRTQVNSEKTSGDWHEFP